MALSDGQSLSTKVSTRGTYTRTITGYADSASNNMNVERSTTLAFGSSGADTINQAVSFVFTATQNTTTRMDLSGALVNALGETSCTLTKIKWILIELPSAAQDATNGTAATSVTISASATNPITTTPLGAAQTYTLENGDRWLIEKHNSGGITVASGTADGLDVLNNDADTDAKLIVTILGNA